MPYIILIIIASVYFILPPQENIESIKVIEDYTCTIDIDGDLKFDRNTEKLEEIVLSEYAKKWLKNSNKKNDIMPECGTSEKVTN